MMKFGKIDPKRIEVSGHADTQPLEPNRDAESRSRNRRVEIIIGTDAKETVKAMMEAGYISEL